MRTVQFQNISGDGVGSNFIIERGGTLWHLQHTFVCDKGAADSLIATSWIAFNSGLPALSQNGQLSRLAVSVAADATGAQVGSLYISQFLTFLDMAIDDDQRMYVQHDDIVGTAATRRSYFTLYLEP